MLCNINPGDKYNSSSNNIRVWKTLEELSTPSWDITKYLDITDSSQPRCNAGSNSIWDCYGMTKDNIINGSIISFNTPSIITTSTNFIVGIQITYINSQNSYNDITVNNPKALVYLQFVGNSNNTGEFFIYKLVTSGSQTFMSIVLDSNNNIIKGSFLPNQNYTFSYDIISTGLYTTTRQFTYKYGNMEKSIILEYAETNKAIINDTNLSSSLLRGYVSFKEINNYVQNYKQKITNDNKYDSYWHFPYSYTQHIDNKIYYITTGGKFVYKISPYTYPDIYDSTLTKKHNRAMCGFVFHEDLDKKLSDKASRRRGSHAASGGSHLT